MSSGGRQAHSWMLPERERTPDLEEPQPSHVPAELQDPPGQ